MSGLRKRCKTSIKSLPHEWKVKISKRWRKQYSKPWPASVPQDLGFVKAKQREDAVEQSQNGTVREVKPWVPLKAAGIDRFCRNRKKPVCGCPPLELSSQGCRRPHLAWSWAASPAPPGKRRCAHAELTPLLSRPCAPRPSNGLSAFEPVPLDPPAPRETLAHQDHETQNLCHSRVPFLFMF